MEKTKRKVTKLQTAVPNPAYNRPPGIGDNIAIATSNYYYTSGTEVRPFLELPVPEFSIGDTVTVSASARISGVELTGQATGYVVSIKLDSNEYHYTYEVLVNNHRDMYSSNKLSKVSPAKEISYEVEYLPFTYIR